MSHGDTIEPSPSDHDVIVVGGGPAGLAAALWAARYRRRVLLLDKGETRNRWVEQSHGYFAFDGASPTELVERARRDLEAYPEVTVLRQSQVLAARTTDDGFVVELAGAASVAGHRLILATGVRDVFPEIEGFFDHYGASVFHCPTCDGYEGQGKDVTVFGWSENVVGFSLGLLDWARSVTIVTDGREFEGEGAHREVLQRHGIALVEDEAVGFVGDRGDLRAVKLAQAGEIECQLAFFSIAHQPASGIALQLGCATTGEGCVIVDDSCETSVPGVYAAGDLTPGIQLIQVATAKGAIAGVSAAQSLRGEKGASCSPRPAPDPEEEIAAASEEDAREPAA
jgi:thioredoxin reductase